MLYLIFNEGYTAAAGDSLTRQELCAESVRLARLLHALMPDEPEVRGLLALLLLTESRHAARTGASGELACCCPTRTAAGGTASRSRRDSGSSATSCAATSRAPYQIQAAIAAVHSDAPSAERTDWRQILALYDQLQSLAPTPVIALNRAVALAEVAGPGPALDAVDALSLEAFHLYHAVRADLLRRLGRDGDACAAYDAAIALAGDAAERSFLAARRDSLKV